MERRNVNRQKQLNDIWLDRVPKLAPQIKRKLAADFGGSEALRLAGAAEKEKYFREQDWRSCFDPSLEAAEEQLALMEKAGIGFWAADDADYPALLSQIPDPPWLLYYRGDPDCLKKTAVAVVGARDSTEYGRWAAYQIGKSLAEAGFLVVSGMARGIDTEAHRGALSAAEFPDGEKSGETDGWGVTNASGLTEASGVTAAVFGCGLDLCYPKSGRSVMERILKHGVLLSEYPPGTPPQAYRFPRRNRIISGLSVGIAVVEAGLKSGSLITAGLAAEQGRDVYAVPGNINRLASVGTNRLIRDGAIPLISPDDILADLGVSDEKITQFTQNQLGDDEKRLYDEVLKHGEIELSELARRLSFSAGKTAAFVTVLEIKGILHSRLGKIYIAKY